MPIVIEKPNLRVLKSQSDIMEDYSPFIIKGFVPLSHIRYLVIGLLVENNLTLSKAIKNLIIYINRTRSFKC